MTVKKTKKPVQQRSMQTVDTLLDAAAQILQTDGESAFNTNRVAERAGFSIGTLYQYFPNKNSIVEALAERERIVIEAAIKKAFIRQDPKTLEDAVRIVVHELINAFGRRRKLRRFVILQMVHLNLASSVLREMDTIGTDILKLMAMRGGVRIKSLSPTSIFVITRAIMGAIRAAIIEDCALLETEEFKDDVVRLAMGFLN